MTAAWDATGSVSIYELPSWAEVLPTSDRATRDLRASTRGHIRRVNRRSMSRVDCGDGVQCRAGRVAAQMATRNSLFACEAVIHALREEPPP